MKRALLAVVVLCAMGLAGCQRVPAAAVITFVTSAEYPPFEFQKNNVLAGFDIDLATQIAKEMGKTVRFENMSFGSVLAALQNGFADAAIATLTITEARKKNFDFSDSYHRESMSVLYREASPLKDINYFKHKKIACQLGTTMEIWLKRHVPEAEIILMDNNNQAVEALKAGQAHGVLIDTSQAVVFSNKNLGLSYSFVANSEDGYGIAFKKGSNLTEAVNNALRTLKNNGVLDKLEKKWLQSSQWKS